MIREAISSDIAQIRSLMQAIPGFWQSWWSDETIGRAVESTNIAFVWVERSEILGFVCAHNLGFRAYLSELAVADHARHRGIGTALVRAVEEALRKERIRILISDVWHDAEPFYRALGWEPPDAILLRQRLGLQDPEQVNPQV